MRRERVGEEGGDEREAADLRCSSGMRDMSVEVRPLRARERAFMLAGSAG